MRWQAIQNLNPAKGLSTLSNANRPCQETQLAQLLCARLLILGQKNQRLDAHVDWDIFYGWLGIEAKFERPSLRDMSWEERDQMRREMARNRPGEHTQTIALLKQWLKEQQPEGEGYEGPLMQITRLVGERMNLSQDEQSFLLFLWLKLRHPVLAEAAEQIKVKNVSQATRLLEEVLLLKAGSLKGLAYDKNPFKRFKLIRWGMHCHDVKDLLESDDFLELLNNVVTLHTEEPLSDEALEAELDEACSELCPLYQGETLGAEDFTYVPQLQFLRDYLADAIKHQRKGRNVLLYGRPGVGKTLLASSLAHWLGAQLYEVPFEDSEGDQLPKHLRIERLLQAQMFMKNKRNTLMLFDEIEDIFTSHRHQPSKAWMNRHLESNPLPTLWLCNDHRMLDPAYLRRFDLVLEIPVPDTEVLQQRRVRQMHNLPVTPDFREWLAKTDWATPALIEQLKQLGQDLPARQPMQNQKKLLQLLEQRCKAEGSALPKDWFTDQAKNLSSKQQEDYSLPEYREEWLNTNPGLKKVVHQIRRLGNARLCLHGHPGTGKTAFANYLAQQLDRPVIVKSASSLLGKYVGETEQQIAEMFAEAKSRNALLLLDEAETFLQSRLNGELRGWEISMVNEMLVQLEKFQGIFIATSNRFEQLDTAMMRRFDLKVAFDWLKPQQLRSLLSEIFKNKPKELKALQELRFTQLTHLQVSPGNLQTALRRLNLQGKPLRLKTLLDALDDEDRAQQKNKSVPIGFIHPGRTAPAQKQEYRPAAKRK